MQYSTGVVARSRRTGPVSWLRAHPRSADVLLAVVLTAVSVTFHIADSKVDPETPDDFFRDPAWWTVLLIAAAILPIAWRRINPVGAALMVVGGQIILELADIDGTGFLGVMVGVYSLGAHSAGRRRTRTISAIVLALTLLFVAGIFVDELEIGSFVSSVVVLGTAFVLGDNLRRRRDAAQSIQDRLERAERERELIAHQRVSAERTRIARELHDVVAHSVSVMVIQAAAARRSLRSSPSDSETALLNIETTGRQTMNELRSILGVLRRNEEADDDHRDQPGEPVGALAPQPTLRDIAGLVDTSIDLPIEVSTDGEISNLPSSVDLTGFRIVQEAITNVRRHAGPVTTVGISIHRIGGQIEIDITDDGRGSAADAGVPGYGLIGMRERVDAIGGSLTATTRRGGGWHVHAILPIAETRAAAVESDPNLPKAELPGSKLPGSKLPGSKLPGSKLTVQQ
jgi:signal transduction histidine kinase